MWLVQRGSFVLNPYPLLSFSWWLPIVRQAVGSGQTSSPSPLASDIPCSVHVCLIHESAVGQVYLLHVARDSQRARACVWSRGTTTGVRAMIQ
jgi:hypothetical protein